MLPTPINPALIHQLPEFSAQFQQRAPFRHVVIENFFAPDYCAQLLAEFPPFILGNARNEAGELGGKSTVEQIRKLGEGFATLDATIQSPEFLDLISRITGISQLLYDPYYFGGGTHENREGQDLDPHIDFNRHPIERWHRRLNLIVYLNHEWHDAWGGSLELHTNPRDKDNRMTLVTPLYNRCVIFETTQWSWHGFSRIQLPDDKKSLSRKSIALYFYTKDRPNDETTDTHSTIYVDRPLPSRFQPGTTLDVGSIDEISALLARRDQHNQRLYRDLQHLQSQLDQAQTALNAGRAGRLWYFAKRLLAHLRR